MFEILGHLSAGFVNLPDHRDGGRETGRGSTPHPANDIVECVKQLALARASDVAEETAFDRIVLGAVAGIELGSWATRISIPRSLTKSAGPV